MAQSKTYKQTKIMMYRMVKNIKNIKNFIYRCLKSRLATSESLCELLEIQIPGPHPSGFCFSKIGRGPGIYVLNPFAGEIGIQPDWKTTELAYPPPLGDEWTGAEKPLMPCDHPHQTV